MDIMTWAWLILAAVLLIGEMITVGFFLIVFGIGALAAFIVAVFGGSVLWQWIVFFIVSAITWAGSRKFANKVHRGPTTYGVGAERYTGLKGYVIEEIDPAAATGMVRVDREEWRADSEDGESIAQDSWVLVTRVDGTRLIVRPLAEGEDAPERHEDRDETAG